MVQQDSPDCPGFKAPESAEKQAWFASVIRETFLRAPGANTITLERDVLSFFDDDRVTASAFLQKHGFVVKEIDGEQQVINAEVESV
jgi:hypothetical protein